ncbi:MAG: hypothetical protein OEZ33_05665 [Gammaproteobacteria bacterium]|nr:hypothetical protein [Gammaproteobacteria bacterium]
MDIINKLGIFLLQGVVYVPLYTVLFCHFLKYLKVSSHLWKRSLLLAIVTYILITLLGSVFSTFSHVWIGQFIGALMIAYLLTQLLVVPYLNAVLAAMLIVVIGQDISPMVINFVNENLISYI